MSAMEGPQEYPRLEMLTLFMVSLMTDYTRQKKQPVPENVVESFSILSLFLSFSVLTIWSCDTMIIGIFY